MTLYRRRPPTEQKALYLRESKGNRIPNILQPTAVSITENSTSLCPYNTEKYRHFNSITSNKEQKTLHQLPLEWALVKCSLSSKFATRCLRTLGCRSCQERYQEPFSGAHHGQTTSKPASQTVFVTRKRHLNETFYLSKYVMFSQQRWTEVSGVSLPTLLPSLICNRSSYWRGSKKEKTSLRVVLLNISIHFRESKQCRQNHCSLSHILVNASHVFLKGKKAQ